MFKTKIGAMLAVGVALALGASPAFAASGWTIVPAPPTGANANLFGVSAVSDSDAWAVGTQNGAPNTGLGSKPLIDNWNGTAWTQATPPAWPANTSVNLQAVSASSSTDAWAVGYTRVERYQFTPAAAHWNGSAWSISATGASALPADTVMRGVTDISPTDAYAFGNNSALASGELEHWNGTAWSQVTYPLPTNTGYDQTLNAISADGPNDVWAIGEYLLQVGSALRWETFALHFNGSTWSDVSMPLVSGSDNLLVYQLNAMDAISPTNVWAVGGSGDNASPYGGTPSNTLIEHWNGTAWSVVASPSTGTDDNLTGVTAVSTTNIWAVGYAIPSGASNGQTLTLNWNGTAWTTVASPNQGSPSVLNAVSVAPGGAVVQAVGEDGVTGSFNPLALQNG
jgi:hypothetical protein